MPKTNLPDRVNFHWAVWIYIGLFLAFCTCKAFGTTWWVDNAGDNANDGKSEGNPMQTLTVAMDSVQGGDTLLFMGGVWKEQNQFFEVGSTTLWIDADQAGSYGDPTTFKCAPGYSRPVISGYGTNGYNESCSTYAVVLENGANYITLDSLIIKHAYRGIFVVGSDSLTVRNCVACSTGEGLAGINNNGGLLQISLTYYSDYMLVENCSMFTNWEESDGTGTGNCGQIETYTTRWSRITNNVFFDGYRNEGLVYIKGTGNHTIEIDNNILYDADNLDGGGIMLLEGPDSCDVHHNVIYNVRRGITIWEYASGGEDNVGHKIYNNTIFGTPTQTGQNAWGIGFLCAATPATGAKGVEIFNNIISQEIDDYDNLRKKDNFTIKDDDKYINYNAYWNNGSTDIAYWSADNRTLAELRSAIYIDSNSVGSYPAFADTTNKDFSLTASSPDSIKTGGRGGSYDTYMGAIEWTGGASSPSMAPFIR
jgi:hypothetical protein